MIYIEQQQWRLSECTDAQAATCQSSMTCRPACLLVYREEAFVLVSSVYMI